MKLSMLKPLCALIASLLMCLVFAYTMPLKSQTTKNSPNACEFILATLLNVSLELPTKQQQP